MDEEEAERQRKLKAGREKLLQFQQKKRGVKKKKKTSAKSGQSDQEAKGSKEASQRGPSSSPANSEHDISVASVDTDQDVSSIASEAEPKIPEPEQQLQAFAPSGEESNAESFASECYTSGEESAYTGTSEDGCVDDLVIANIERNELKSRTVELEEQLTAKTTALRDVSKENAELKTQLDVVTRPEHTGHNLNQKVFDLEKILNEKQSRVNELQSENDKFRRMVDEYNDLERSESSQVEELKGKLKTKQETLDVLNKQNEDLSQEVSKLKLQFSSPKDETTQLYEMLKTKEDACQQLIIKNENQKTVMKSLEESLNQSKTQLVEYYNVLQEKDQQLSQLSNYKAYCESVRENMVQLNEQLLQKNQEIQMVCHDRDQRLWQASQELTRLQQVISEKEEESKINTTTTEEHKSKTAEIAGQLAEKDTALENIKNQLEQILNQQNQSEEELLIVKQHLQEQTEKNALSQEQISSAQQYCKEKEERISMLEQQLDSLSQVHRELSHGSQTVSQQMIDLQTELKDRNQKISHLEISLSELSEERELIRNEMQKQSQELIDQIKDLHAQLNESNAKVKEQGDEMENSFSELHVTQDMIKELQKEMLEKDLSLDNLSQKLQIAESEQRQALDGLQLKMVQEKEMWQNELEEKEKLLSKLNVSLLETKQQLSEEKALGNELRTKIENMNVEVENHRNKAIDLAKDLTTKEEALANLEEHVTNTTQRHNGEVESLKLELEKVKETTPDLDRRMAEISEEHEKELKQVQQQLVEKESRVQELISDIKERDQRIANLELEVDDSLSEVRTLEDQLNTVVIERDEAITNGKTYMENLQNITENSEKNLAMELSRVQSQYQNEMASLQNQHSEELSRLRNELDAKNEELQTTRSFSEIEVTEVKENYAKEIESVQAIDEDLRVKSQVAEQLAGVTAANESKIENLKEQLGEQRKKYENTVELSEILSHEKDELQSKLLEQVDVLSERDGLLMKSQNEVELLNEKLKALEGELDELRTNIDQLTREKEQYEERLHHFNDVNTQVSEKLQVEKEQNERNITVLKNEIKEWQEKYEVVVKEKGDFEELFKVAEENLSLKKDELCEKVEELRKNKELHENEEMLEKESEMREKKELFELTESLREKEEELRATNEKLCKTCEELRDRDDELRAKCKELQDMDEELRQRENELRTKEDEHEHEIKVMDNEVEQTRQMIENLKTDSEKKIAAIKESLGQSKGEFETQLHLKEEEHKNALDNMKSINKELKEELEKEKWDCVNMKKQLETLTTEKEVMAARTKELESFDWPSDYFDEEPVVVRSENMMESQAGGDGPSIFPEEQSSHIEEQLSQHQNDIAKKIDDVNSTEHVSSLQRISVLQEKLAEKEKSELGLIEEKNKLLKIVKEYNESLANERDTLKEKIIDQDQIIQELQEQLSTSEMVSSDLQEVFGRQLLVLQEQRDTLLVTLDEQKRDQSSFVDILEEKHALEENLRTEKEQLADKLRQKEILESQLEQERTALQEQLIRQAKLNEIIKEKDVLEEELMEQKNRLETELGAIENSLIEKERLLQSERETLQAELFERDCKLRSWEGEFRTKEMGLIEERERLEKMYTDTLLATRTELEDTYEQNLEHLRTELDAGYRQRLFQMEEDFQLHHEGEIGNLARQHEQQVTGLKTEYEEKIKNLKEILEEQRRKQVYTMKNVLERNREMEVEQIKDEHGSDMEELRKELTKRHQDIVNALVDRLKRSHQREMEDCLAGAITETVLKVEVARLEVEQEYEVKFDELRKKTKLEIENLNKLHEEETNELREMHKKQKEQAEHFDNQYVGEAEELKEKYQDLLEKIKQLEKRNIDLVEELTSEHEKNTEAKVGEVKEKIRREYETNLESVKEEIEMQYEDQMENLQEELELKYENGLRELREELERQSQEITATAVEELQKKHFSETDILKSEHEHDVKRMNIVREKLEAGYKEDINDLEEKVRKGKEKLLEMESRLEKMINDSKKNESERMDTLRSTMEQKTVFLQQEHDNKISDITKETEKILQEKDRAFNEETLRIKDEFEKEKMSLELNHMNELREIAADADKRVFEKEQEHVKEINNLQQKLLLLKEEGEESRFLEIDESRKQLSEKYQKDLDAIVRELKLKHQKQIENLISEAESNQINNEAIELEKWKASMVEKYEKEISQLKNQHQKELDTIRKMLTEERMEEVTRVTSSLSSKYEREIEELRTKITKEFEEEMNKIVSENKCRYENEITSLSEEKGLLRLQHEEDMNSLKEKLTGTFSEKLEKEEKELRIYKDVAQEKEVEIENIKRDHEKEMKELKQGHFDDLLEEVSQIRSDLALDLAREVELVKMETDYQLVKKVKEIKESHEKEIAVYVGKVESLGKEKDSLTEILRVHAEETLQMKMQLQEEKKELDKAHSQAIEELKAKLDVQQQNTLNELKLRLLSEMESMQEEYKKMTESFTQRESKLERDLKEREKKLANLKRDHEQELSQLTETLNRQNQTALDELNEENEKKLREIEDKFAIELKSQKESIEKEKENDMAALEHALNGSINEKQELQIKLINEQHGNELESLREELVKTHMEKFTLMTEQLEQAHQEELAQVRQSVQENASEEFQTQTQQAVELARYNMEQEHLENLKQLEESLLRKHEGQITALNGLLEHHQAQLDKMNEDHEVEKQNIINEWQKKISGALTTVKSEHEKEIIIKDEQINKSEAELKRYVQEMEKKDINMNALAESIANTNTEYEERLAEMRQEFDKKLEEMKNSVNGSNEAQIHGMQELLSKQHVNELERLNQEHEKQINLLNNELEDARALNKQTEEEYKTKIEEHEHLFNSKIDELRGNLTTKESEVKELKEKNENIQAILDEKQNEFNKIREQKQAADMQCRSLEETVKEMMNRHERERLEDSNMIKMLNADLDALNSERDTIQRAKANVLRQLSAVVRTTMITEETINSRLETLLEQTQREDGEVSEINSISEDSMRDAFKRRQGGPTLVSSTPAVGPAAAAQYDDDDEDDERTLTDNGMKEAEVSLASDEGLELSAVLSDPTLQGSLDLQNEEAIVDSGNRLRVAVQKILDMVASVTQQLQNARSTQDELFNTTSQRTAEINQLSQAQQILMARLEEEIEIKDDTTNKLRKAEEEMETYVAEIDRLEKLKNENESKNEETSKSDVEKQKEIDVLKNEKKELLNKVESLKTKTEEMEKSYEKEKQDLWGKITDLQEKVNQIEVSHQDVPEGDQVTETVQADGLQTMIENLKLECANKEAENVQMKDVQQELQSQICTLEENKLEIEKELCKTNEEVLQKQQRYEEEINRLKVAAMETQTTLRSDKNNLVIENDRLQEKVDTLNATFESLASESQKVTDEKVLIQNTFEEHQLVWEDEKNSLQQELYDSYLETSSLKEKLKSKRKQGDGSAVELDDKISEQAEAFKKLKNDAAILEELVKDLKKSLSLKDEEINVLGQSVKELKENLISQQELLEEQRNLLSHAENTKMSDDENIRNLKDALSEAVKKVEEGEIKMEELLTNMKNLEDSYKAETGQVTQRLNKKVDELQKELNESKVNLEQQKNQSNYSIANHISELKQHHNKEIQSLRHQFEIDIQDAIERTKAENNRDGFSKKIQLDYSTEIQGNISDHDTSTGARLNIELMGLDHFTDAISGYLSDLPPLSQDIFNEKDVHNNSTNEMIDSILNDVKVDADAIYTLVNHLPVFYDSNLKSLQMAWTKEKDILVEAIEQLKEIALQKPEISTENDWRATILSSVLDLLNKEEEMLSSELQAMDRVQTPSDPLTTSKFVKRRQEKQDELHRQCVEELHQIDRASLMNELSDLQTTLATVKEELTQENNKLHGQLKSIQEHVQRREKEFLEQVASKEKLVNQERDIISRLRAEQEANENRLHDANDLIQRERTLVKDLQDVLNNNKTRMNVLESAIQKEKTQTAVIQTCLDSERSRCLNLEEALKRERLNVESHERDIENKNKLLQEMSGEDQKSIEKLKTVVLQGKQLLSEREAQVEQERAKNLQLQKEITDNQNNFALENAKLSNLVKSLGEDLKNEKTRNAELVKTLDEEQKISEELKSSLGSIDGVNEQISEQEQLITELSQALEKERMVNEELRNALDNEYESIDKTDDRQLNVVKELQTSLKAVQDQLQNQIEVVDQERTRTKRLRKERDIHEATALGARDKEEKLETQLEMEKAARDMEVKNLKDVIERKISEKKDLEEMINHRNTEFEVLCKELQRLKDTNKNEQREMSTSPSRERLSILRYDLKSLIDEHRVLLIMHKDYLNQQSKHTFYSENETNSLRTNVETLLSEMDRMKMLLGTIPEGPSIPLSPIKAAAYDRVTKQNKELTDYIAKLTDEKEKFRTTLNRLEHEMSEYRQREANYEKNSRQNKQELETLLAVENSRFAQERLTIHQMLEEHKRTITELENKLTDKENELNDASCDLRNVREELGKYTSMVERLQSTENACGKWTIAKIQKLYGRYMRAEKGRKSLAYQKKYLILMLGGFRESESITLSLIAKMGAYPSFQQPPSRFSPAFTRFRTAVRVVIAVKRMALLVRKYKSSVRQVAMSSAQKIRTSDVKFLLSTNTYKPSHSQASVSSTFSPLSHSVSEERPNIAVDSNDNIQELRKPWSRTPRTEDVHSDRTRDYAPRHDLINCLSTDTRCYGVNTTNNFVPTYQTTSYFPPTSSNVLSSAHSPPVKETASRYSPTRSAIPISSSLHHLPYGSEIPSPLGTEVYPQQHSPDLESKIRTLDNLQQKLSAARGPSDPTRRF